MKRFCRHASATVPDWFRNVAELRVVPGKLMLAGEYAVLRPHGVALAVAVGDVVRSKLSLDAPGVTMHAFDQTFVLESKPWHATGLLGFVARALAWLEQHAGLSLACHLTLDVTGAVGGAKVGLGTSAAVTIATVRAVLEDRRVQWSPGQLAEAARQIHAGGQGTGSGYDVTTIAFGGCVAYERSPDRARHVPWPSGLYGLALFSGEPAPTQAALDKVPMAQARLDAIDRAARYLLQVWSGPPSVILTALQACDDAFVTAATDDPSLIPPPIAAVRERIVANGCVTRASGAGGGDCVLAFADNADAITRLAHDWQCRGGHLVAHLPADIAPEVV